MADKAFSVSNYTILAHHRWNFHRIALPLVRDTCALLGIPPLSLFQSFWLLRLRNLSIVRHTDRWVPAKRRVSSCFKCPSDDYKPNDRAQSTRARSTVGFVISTFVVYPTQVNGIDPRRSRSSPHKFRWAPSPPPPYPLILNMFLPIS